MCWVYFIIQVGPEVFEDRMWMDPRSKCRKNMSSRYMYNMLYDVICIWISCTSHVQISEIVCTTSTINWHLRAPHITGSSVGSDSPTGKIVKKIPEALLFKENSCMSHAVSVYCLTISTSYISYIPLCPHYVLRGYLHIHS